MTFYRGYHYKCHYLYIFIIHFFLFTQFYPLFLIFSIDHHYFLSIYLFVVTVGTFVFVFCYYWYLCDCLGPKLVRCQYFFFVLGYTWYCVIVVKLLFSVCLSICNCYWCSCTYMWLSFAPFLVVVYTFGLFQALFIFFLQTYKFSSLFVTCSLLNLLM